RDDGGAWRLQADFCPIELKGRGSRKVEREGSILMAMIRHRLLAIVPVFALLALSSCGGMALIASATDEWTHTYPLAASGEGSIDNTNGRGEVDPADGETVEIHAERIAKAATDAGARELLPRITINEDIKPNRV